MNERTQIVREVHRDYGEWSVRCKDVPYHLARMYVCGDEMNNYFDIPITAERGWVTLSYARERPGPEWIKLKLTYKDSLFSRNAIRTLHIEPWPGYGGAYRQVPLHRPFAADIEEVGLRPAGGIWCWMQFEYEVK